MVARAPVQLKAPQLAGTWYSMAMGASDFSLLETKEATLRVYITSLQPTPEGNLEIGLQKRLGSAADHTTQPRPSSKVVMEARLGLLRSAVSRTQTVPAMTAALEPAVGGRRGHEPQDHCCPRSRPPTSLVPSGLSSWVPGHMLWVP
ncbi:hypothetical protein P7K49_001989 [Saguinus oedipus]|uniref:Lipocalin/cytosolic fatty-acid binding domain-containing protein n=1 Tax=Saguinus oedipus TaxID=9490 RepID=A0ABQ9WG49_SAGOE|nr:hypothetical protein P7K49_001989 [Saguinus oedipus]